MCVDHDARLPALPPGQFEATTERLTLTASDGNVFNAFAATSGEDRPAVVVLPDIRGLFKFYEDLAQRLAEEGYPSIAIDYFGRTAGTGHRDSDFPFMEHVAQVNADGFHADLRAAVDYLRQSSPDRPIYTVGFCFGGSMSWAAATRPEEHGLAGAIGFYGKPEADRPVGDGSILDRCGLIECKVLSLFGGNDPGIPQDSIDALTRAMTEAGVDYESVVYEDAPHSFFDRTQSDHAEASLDAWNRMLTFIT